MTWEEIEQCLKDTEREVTRALIAGYKGLEDRVKDLERQLSALDDDVCSILNAKSS